MLQFLERNLAYGQDMYRYPSRIVRVSFEGPDPPEEALYSLFRVRMVHSLIGLPFFDAMLALRSNLQSYRPYARACRHAPLF